jgi:hypothetical protein
VQHRIRVDLRAPSGSGRLRPRYDDEADLLEVGSPAKRQWPFGVDIAGTIIFDLDRNRLLANVEVLVPKRLWRVASMQRRPQARKAADLVFSPETLAVKSFELPITITTDSERSYVSITFGEAVESTEVIELSDQCFAYVDDGSLLGFFVVLSNRGES